METNPAELFGDCSFCHEKDVELTKHYKAKRKKKCVECYNKINTAKLINYRAKKQQAQTSINQEVLDQMLFFRDSINNQQEALTRLEVENTKLKEELDKHTKTINTLKFAQNMTRNDVSAIRKTVREIPIHINEVVDDLRNKLQIKTNPSTEDKFNAYYNFTSPPETEEDLQERAFLYNNWQIKNASISGNRENRGGPRKGAGRPAKKR